MSKLNVESLYKQIDERTIEIEQQQNIPYLDALGSTLESLFYKETAEQVDEVDPDTVKEAIQFAILKGMKHTTQSQHLITPESVSLLIGYLAHKFLHDKEKVRIFDPVAGTGSLLLTVIEQLQKETEAHAAEVDSTLIKLGVANANLQKTQVEFLHQDSLRPMLVDPVDIVVADLPVGYYPDDEQAKEFDLNRTETHAYSHELFIEQSLNYLTPSGYAILVIPDHLFEQDSTQSLHRFIHEHAYIVGLLRLPETSFKSEKHVKSILILRKKSEEISMPKQPLLVQLPSLNNTVAMEQIINQINEWFESYLSGK